MDPGGDDRSFIFSEPVKVQNNNSDGTDSSSKKTHAKKIPPLPFTIYGTELERTPNDYHRSTDEPLLHHKTYESSFSKVAVDKSENMKLRNPSQDSQDHCKARDVYHKGVEEFRKNKRETPSSPSSQGHFKYQESTLGDIRHQLLVQRTFTTPDDHPEPRTSSPLRKMRVCTEASSLQTVTVSPSSGSGMLETVVTNTDARDANTHPVQPQKLSPFLSPNDNATSELHPMFKTPVRSRTQDRGMERTPSHCGTPMILSPANSSPYCFTPGRQFSNPFEVDHERLHMPMFSPNMFQVVSSGGRGKIKDKESFWSVEHAALIMPADIKESEVHRQHRYQQKIDKEQDVKIQKAINKFFSNEVIVPSPWGEKVKKHELPRTPGAIKSVSCQTVLSVPPHVDLLAELQDKYQLPEHHSDLSPVNESNSFIRRKLLNQLNENDSVAYASPAAPTRAAEDFSSSPSPGKQLTPEWEKQTPQKSGSGHFSSSPIRLGPDERGHHHGLSEMDLLASPELSPIAGRASKSVRSSGIYFSHQDSSSPRAIMQLDFSSILDDPDDLEEDDKMGTLIQKRLSSQPCNSSTQNDDECHPGSTERPFFTSNASQDSGDNADSKSGGQFQRTLLTSGFSSESTNDMAGTMPQTFSSQDTGYQTTSLQSTYPDSASNSNLASLEGGPYTSALPGSECSSTGFNDYPELKPDISSSPFAGVGKAKDQRHVPRTDITEEFIGLKYKSDMSLDADGSFLGLAPKEKSSSADEIVFLRKDEPCRVRKVRTLSDIRLSKEKRCVSRDLTQSFNDEVEKSDSKPNASELYQTPNLAAFPNNVLNLGAMSQMLLSQADSECERVNTAVPAGKLNNRNSDHYDIVDVSMRSISPQLDSSLDRKGHSSSDSTSAYPLPKYSDHKNILHQVTLQQENIHNKVQSKFLIEDDNTLKEARLLLGKSEEFRMKLVQPEIIDEDTKYPLTTGNNENQNPEAFTHKLVLTEGISLYSTRPETPPFRIDPKHSSTPTSRTPNGARKKTEHAEEGKLGSEIAAEILRRAGDDLAKLTSLIESSSPSSQH